MFVEKDGRIDTVILSVQQYASLIALHERNAVIERKKHFEQTHKAWIDEQNGRIEQNGLWCDALRVW